jgi:hypothetical protein
MTLTRSVAWALISVTGLALPANKVAAEEPPFPIPRPNDAFRGLSDAREARGIPKADLPAYQPQFAAVAKYFADFISHPAVYRFIQDPTKLPKDVFPEALRIDEKMRELERLILEPNPAVKENSESSKPKVSEEKGDYIRELGIALDAAFKPIIEKSNDKIVRVNAMRMYAAVCRSGAAAHWPTVTALLTKQNTPTEVKYYALQAAANLLSAYDVYDYRSRRHSIGSKLPRAAADKEIGALVKAVQDCVLNPNMILNDIPEGKIENATVEQLEVIRYVRRQAIKSLGQVRFVTLPGPDGEPLYPAQTLIRVCMSDPTLIPAPSPTECGEAVIGLCNMAPVFDGAPVKGYNPDTAIEAMTTGLLTFAGPRAASALDRSTAWRTYSVRMMDAFKVWKPIHDPLFDPVEPNKFTGAPAAVPDFITRAQNAILIPMEKVDSSGKPDLGAPLKMIDMQTYLKGLQEKPGRTGLLINGIPQTALPTATPPKK